MTTARAQAKRRWISITFVAILSGSMLAGAGLSGHLNELLPGLAEALGSPPKTGNAQVDTAVQTFLDEYETLRSEPQVPANYFYSSAGSDLRIGGLGDWVPLIGDGQGFFREPVHAGDWDETKRYPFVGEFGFSFGNLPNGEYRRETVSAYYVSPLIDLRSFLVTTDVDQVGSVDLVQPVGQGVDQAGGSIFANPPVQAQQIKLRFYQKFNFALDNDGGRVEVFTGRPEPGRPIAPAGVIMPDILSTDAPAMRGTAAFGSDPSGVNLAFTGVQRDWRLVEFDLSEFAGQQIYVALHVATNIPPAVRQNYFDIAAFFPTFDKPGFFGWKLDAIQVEGPAHHTNLRVRSVVEPFFRDPATGALLAPTGSGPLRGDHSVFTVLIENRGSVTEQGFPVEFRVTGPSGPVACPNNGRVDGPMLRPGGNALVTIACAPLVEGAYTLHVAARTSARVPDGDPGDNAISVPFEGRTVARLETVSPVSVQPPVAESQDFRVVQIHALNTGNDAVEVRLNLTVQSIEPEGLLVPPFPNPVRESVVPVGAEVREEWALLLPMPGTYLVRLDVDVNGERVLRQDLRAATLVSVGDLFFDNHTGQPLGNIVGAPDWTKQSFWSPPPPTNDAYWGLMAHEDDRIPGQRFAQEKFIAYLNGTAPLVLTQVPDVYSELHILVRHHVIPRCGAGWDGANVGRPGGTNFNPGGGIRFFPWGTCRIIDVGAANLGTINKDGIGNHEFFLTTREVGISQTGDSAVTTIAPVEILLQKVRSTGPDRDRERFYAMNWVEEEIVVRPQDIHPNLTVIPRALLEHISFEARATYGSCFQRWPPGATVGTAQLVDAPHESCPVWQIDEVRMQAVPIASPNQPVTVLHTTGQPNGEIGTWYSGMYHGPGRHIGARPPPAFGTPYQNRGCLFYGPSDVGASTVWVSTTGLNEDPDEVLAGCPVWNRVVNPSNTPSAWSLHNEAFLRGGPAWWMGPEEIGIPIDYTYPHEALDALISPTIQIPSGLDEPTLKFFHKFDFRTGPMTSGFPTWRPGEVLRDYGAVFVQFMSDDADPKPISPFFQLLLDPDEPLRDPDMPDRALNDGAFQVFMGNSCAWYGTPGCLADLSQRDMELASIPLEPLRIFDYRGLDATTVDLSMDWVMGDSHPRTVDQWRLDVLALEQGSISIRETGARLRFAFVQMATNHVPPGANQADGWFIGPVLVAGESLPAHDVALTDLSLDISYDAAELGLGPGSTVDMVARVENRGLFSQPRIAFQVLLTNAETGTIHTTTAATPDGFVLGTLESAEFPIQVAVPDAPGTYHMMVRANLPGRVDNILANNCRDYDVTENVGRSNENCNPTQAPPLDVRRFVDFGIEATVTPLAGRVDDAARGIFFPRTTLVEVVNSGNVPVSHTEVVRTVRKITGVGTFELVGARHWVVPTEIPPGEAARFENLHRVLVSGTPGESDLSLSFSDPARYVVTFEVRHAEDLRPENDLRLVFVDAWEVFYSNNFEPGGEDRSLASFGEWRTGGPGSEAWHQSTVESFIDPFGRGRTSYWFGDPARDDYPATADAWLQMPAMDLSNASLAFLNFRTMYDLEAQYDGGIVEASIDDGATWFLLRPDPLPPFLPDGYAGSLVSSNPLNAESDPTVAIDAFTGDSRGILQDTDWIPVTIDLGREVAPFQNQLVIDAFDQSGFDGSAVYTDPTQRLRTHHTWRVVGEECPRCWMVQNVAQGVPSMVDPVAGPLFPGVSEFWWSNNIAGIRTLRLNLSHEEVRFDQDVSQFQIWVTWWEYRGGGTITPNLAVVEQAGDWVRVAQEITVQYRNAANVESSFFDLRYGHVVNAHSRGWAITNPQLLAYTVEGGGLLALQRAKDIPIQPLGHWIPGGWQLVDSIDWAPEGWRVAEAVTNRQRIEPVWVFRNAEPAANDFFTYPANANERLITPAIDLTTVVGEAELEYFERGFLRRQFGATAAPSIERRIVDVQVLNRFTVPPTWGPWETLRNTNAQLERENWAAAAPLPLGDYAGQTIRLGFRLLTAGNPQPPAAATPHNGWWLDGIQVRGETMVGGPLLIRFRAGTDPSVSGAGWGIDNVEIVGRSYSKVGGNVAVLPEEGIDRRAAPGATLWFNGTVRNLSPKIWVGLGLEAIVELPNGDQPLVAVAPEGLLREERPGVLGPFNLLPGSTVTADGRPSDRIPFAFRLDLPETIDIGGNPVPLIGNLDVKIRAVQLRGEELLTLRDENFGDHHAQVRVQVALDNDLRIIDRFVTLRDPSSGEPTQFGLRVSNAGTLPAATEVEMRVRHVAADGAVDQLAPAAASLMPGEVSTTFQWTWAAPAPGVYAVEYVNNASYLGGAPDQERLTYLFVDQDLRFFYDPLDDLDDIGPYNFDNTVWSREAGPAVLNRPSGNGCGAGTIQTAEVSFWQPTRRALIGDLSLVTAVDDAEFIEEGQRYPPRMDDGLYQPLVDLRGLLDTGRSGNPPVLDDVFLNFWYRPMAGAGDGLTAYVRMWDPENEAFFSQLTIVPDDTTFWTPLAGAQVPCDNPIRVYGAGMFGGVDDNWRRASFDLTQRNGILGQLVQPVYRFGANGVGELQGVFLDSVSVSGYNARVEPERQTFWLTDSAEKVYHFRVTNTAPVRDRFEVAIDAASTSLPSHVADIEVLTPILELGAGEVGVASVRLKTPLDRDLFEDGPYALTVLIISLSDPNRAARSVIDFEVFTPRFWPDLVAELRLADPAAGATEGEPVSFLATINNFGLSTSPPTTYTLHACPVTDALPLATCLAGTDHLVSEGEVPAVRPFIQTGRTDLSRHLVPGTWTPPVGGAGPYALVLRADPKALVEDYDRTNNRAELPLTVTELRLPDLRIVPEEFQIFNRDGFPVQSVLEGELVHIRAVVENIGNHVAPGVTVRIVNQFTLQEVRLARLGPDERVEVRANWIAMPGTWVIKVDATSAHPEFSLDNNAMTLKLLVHHATFAMDVEELLLAGIPGDAWEVPVRLTNLGEAPIHVLLRARGPASVRAEVALPVVTLEPEEERVVALRILSEAATPAGRHVVIVESSIQGTSAPPASSPIEIHLQGRPQARIAQGVSGAVAEGVRTFSVPVVNRGTAEELFLPRIEAPTGWVVTPRQTVVRLAPGAGLDLQVDVKVPDGFRPGEYLVRVALEGTTSTLDTTLRVLVPAVARIEATTVRDAATAVGERTLLVRLSNLGNAPGTPTIILATQEHGVHLVLDPPVGPLEPGQSSLHTVVLRAPGPATPSADLVHVDGAPVRSAATGAAAPTLLVVEDANLVLSELAVTPRLEVKPGQRVRVSALVENRGGVHLPEVPVVLFANGVLAGHHAVRLAPGQAERVEFVWLAEDGLNVLMVVADPYDEVPETAREDNLASQVLPVHKASEGSNVLFVPHAPFWIVLVGFVAAVRMRRRAA